MRLPGKGMSWKEFFVALKDEWAKDNVGNVAGALTFFMILAIFPFLLFLLALASVIIDPSQAETLVDELGQVAPSAATEILGGRIRTLGEERNVGMLTVGALGALWAASGGIVALMTALNAAYDVEETRPFWKVRGIAILMTIVTGLLAIVATVVVVAAPPVAAALGGPLETAIIWLRLPAAGLLMILLWAMLYYALPNVEQRFKFLTPGSVIGVIIWLAASWGFSVYVSNFGNYDATYGSLGGVIVLLLWIWISSQALLLGAEINAVIEHRSPEGKRKGAKGLEDAGLGPEPEEAPRRPSRRPVPATRSGAGAPRGGSIAGTLALVSAAFVGAFLARRRREA